MEVLRDNFAATWQHVEQAVKDATFLAFDTELTGLTVNGSQRIATLDDMQDRYDKIRVSGESFLIIQFGLAAFKWIPETRTFEAKPFNFYVFPKPMDRNAPDRVFMSQCSSIDFLVSNGFDFNKLFRQGIPYISQAQSALRAQRQQARTESQAPGASDIPLGDNKQFIEDVCKSVYDWLQSSTEPTLDLPACNAFLRRLIFQECEKRFPRGITLSSKALKGAQRCVSVSRATEEQRKKLETDRAANQERDAGEAIGFRRVIDAIGASKKPIVGHNALLDLCNMYAQFIGHLPPLVADFKAAVLNSFGAQIIDTKYVASHPSLHGIIEGTALGELHDRICKPPFVLGAPQKPRKSMGVGDVGGPRPSEEGEIAIDEVMADDANQGADEVGAVRAGAAAEGDESDGGDQHSCALRPARVILAEGFDQYADGTSRLHEAGYDAYVTGACFVGLASHFQLSHFATRQKDEGGLACTCASGTPGAECAHAAAVCPTDLSQPWAVWWANRMFMMRSDAEYLRLDGPDAPPPREHAFYLSEFPDTWRQSDIVRLFRPYGDVSIQWVNSTAAVVFLVDKSRVGEIIPGVGAVIATEGLQVKLGTYDDFARIREASRKRPLEDDADAVGTAAANTGDGVAPGDSAADGTPNRAKRARTS